MIPPPYSASDARGLDHTYDDVRIPDTWKLGGDLLERREPMPVGYQAIPAMPARRVDSPCVVSREAGVAGAGLLRHLFDAIEVAGPEQYAEDEAAPSRFALTLSCVRCGYVEHYAGARDPGREAHKTHRLNPDPLRAAHLEAQETHERDSWDSTGEPWSLTVYRHLDELVEAAGVIARERGPRGRRYYVGRLGGLRDGRRDDDPRAEGPTALAVLRRLAKLDEARQAERLAELAELRRRNAEEEAERVRQAEARARELAARVAPLRQVPAAHRYDPLDDPGSPEYRAETERRIDRLLGRDPEAPTP